MWLSPEAIATWEPAHLGTRGGQPKYSNLAIETPLTLRLLFHLPLRQTEGFLASIFGILGLALSVPDHTTLSRRGQSLDLALRRVRTGNRLHLVADSTELSIIGEGEWAAAKQGGRGKRGWKKLHLGVDRSGYIIAHAVTDATVDDALTGVALIEGITGAVASLTADVADDTIAFYAVAAARGARSCCRRPRPPRRWGGDRARGLAIGRLGSLRTSDDDSGRRHPATIGRLARRMLSSGTSRSSGVLFELAVQEGRWPRHSSHATS